MERVITGEEAPIKGYSVKWIDILLNFGLSKLKNGILRNQQNGWLGSILKNLFILVIMTCGLLLTLKQINKWIKCLGLVSNIINALNIRLRLMIVNMMNILKDDCSKNLLCSFLVNFIDNDFSYLHNIVIYLSL